MLPDALRIRIFELFHPVLILVGTCCARIKENRSFGEKKKIRFVTAINLIKFTDQGTEIAPDVRTYF